MKNYIEKFFGELNQNMNQISWQEIAKAIKLLHATYEHGGRVYLVGNGGSSAIASHFANDLNKTTLGHRGDKKMKRFQAIALVDNTPVLTAWANDVGYDHVFSEQLKNFIQPHDLLIAVSSSGNSANIINAVLTAKDYHVPVIGLCGFTGGKLGELADCKIFVPSDKYGIVENLHDAVCHLITNYFYDSLESKTS